MSNNSLAQESASDDPYLWLEEVESDEALNWVRKQNYSSEDHIKSKDLFVELKEKYLAVSNDQEKIATPNIVGDYIYNFWQDDKNVRGVWRRMKKTDYLKGNKEWETILDLDQLSKNDNVKWVFDGATFLEPENKICLLALSDGGKDENIIREFDIETKDFVIDGFFFEESKGGVSWIDENTLLVYRNFGPGTLTDSGYPRQVKILKRGENVEDSNVLFETPTNSVGAFGGSYFQNEKYMAYIYEGLTFYSSNLYFLQQEGLKKLNFPQDANFSGNFNNEILIALQSDWTIYDQSFKTGSLVSFDLNENLKGDFKVKLIYEPNEKSSFESSASTKDFLLVNILENVQNRILKYNFENGAWKASEIKAPDFGSISIVDASTKSNDYFFVFSNFITPSSLYHSTGADPKIIQKRRELFNTSNLKVEQNFVKSKDGTMIPYFTVSNKNMKLNGKNPTMIYAYGGFNSSEQPYYNSTVGIGWLEKGGVYVLANIRGGGEFGPEWHKAAMKEKRQNAYDDFYAVAGDLINKKVTSPNHLGASGWSNGGLMAGVLFTQRPDLFNAVVVGAPLLDMKRFSRLLAGASWMGEYGNPDLPEDWEYIQKYSPYHNLSPDKKYPEVFFVTSTKDDRVHPGHARKMAARMSEMGHPYFYHETIEGGHGAASTNEQRAEVSAMIYTYFNMKLIGE